jgi:transcriptional regulator with XRE-family HTH domain
MGPYPRVPERIGRHVTQEEFAEVIGVSREWYSRLENGMIPRASAQLVQRIALALELDDVQRLEVIGYGTNNLVAANARLERAAREGVLESVSQLRHFIQRVALCSTFAAAAQLAVETTEELLHSDCVTMVTLEDGTGAFSGFATGPRARYWTDTCTRIAYRIHEPLRSGGIGIVENAPTPDELIDDETASLSWTRRNGELTEYTYEFEAQVWREHIGRLKGRSGVAIPLFEEGLFRGVLGVGWLSPRKVDDLEIEVAKTAATIVELTASRSLPKPSPDS